MTGRRPGWPVTSGWLAAGLPVLVAALLVAVATTAELATLELGGIEPGPAGRPPPPELSGGAPPTPADPGGSGWPAWAAAGLVLLAGLAVAGAAVWLLLRWLPAGWRWRPGAGRWYRLRAVPPAGAPGPAAAPDRALLAAVDEAVARSDDDPDPRRAVIACWLRLEEAAAAAGTPRRDSDTATDLVLRLLRRHQVSEPVLAALATAYRRARFAASAVDEPTRTQARTALRRLRAELVATDSPAPAGGR